MSLTFVVHLYAFLLRAYRVNPKPRVLRRLHKAAVRASIGVQWQWGTQ